MSKGAMENRAFVISAVVLLVAALGVQATSKWMKLHFRKLPVELKRSLQNFDATKLSPSYVLKRTDKISSEVEEALGTHEYYQAGFEDMSRSGIDDPGRYVNFFVTYYTGDPDQVPHIPDVCYLGGGYDPAGSFDTTISLPGLGIPGDELPVRVLFFKNSRAIIPLVQTVVYFFSVNGHFAEERTKVRAYLADIRLKYAYFSKVELSFQSQGQPDRALALDISERFFRKALPVLMSDHWVDWDRFIEEHRGTHSK